MKLLNGDCLELMKQIPDKSIDMILCDLPYGTTACKWDNIIPFDKLWEQYNRVIKDNSAIVLFGSEPFSSQLRLSNLKYYRYDLIWDKKIPSGMSYARFQPMRQTENISIFYKGKAIYNPQMIKRTKPIKSGGMKNSGSAMTQGYIPLDKIYEYKNPTNLLVFDKIRNKSVHPTQKPVALLEYLIRTYTNENMTVLDNTMGSGSTGVACINTNRDFIGIELDVNYFNIAKKRIEEAINNKASELKLGA